MFHPFQSSAYSANKGNISTVSLWRLIILTDPLSLNEIYILACFWNLTHGGKVSDMKSELQLCCFKMNNVYWVRHWVKRLVCSRRKIFVSIAGKADSPVYAASLLDRETWEPEKSTNLATRVNAVFVTKWLISMMMSFRLQITPLLFFLVLENKVMHL